MRPEGRPRASKSIDARAAQRNSEEGFEGQVGEAEERSIASETERKKEIPTRLLPSESRIIESNPIRCQFGIRLPETSDLDDCSQIRLDQNVSCLFDVIV